MDPAAAAAAAAAPAPAPASNDKESMVDPFLVEALQNPRHRLTSKLLACRLPISLARFRVNCGDFVVWVGHGFGRF